jgi:hypothetical protein
VTRRWTLLLALLVLAISACTNTGGGGKAGPGETPRGSTRRAAIGSSRPHRGLLAIEQGPATRSRMGIPGLDQRTGEVLASRSRCGCSTPARR